jgi:vanillate/3-O-methylgallate O-demethylase
VSLAEATQAYAPLSLQRAIDQAGSPVALLWKPGAAPWTPPVLEPEYVSWRTEQSAWSDGVALSDLSHHMSDLFIQGPDAVSLLSAFSANDYESFAIGQAKQFIPVTERGYIVTDGILMREGAERFTLSGVPAAQSWVRYHGERGGYDVSFDSDPDSEFRPGDPVLFRYQVQGPRALELVERVFGAPLPATKFFHSTPVTLGGRSFRAFRHGMAGQAGYEFIGQWQDGEYVKQALLEHGAPLGLVMVGALAYSTNGIESGWIPTPTPAIYTDPALREYRESLSVFSYEGQKPLHGSFFSEDIEDYYCSPWELGYGRSVRFNHDFLGELSGQRYAREGHARARPRRGTWSFRRFAGVSSELRALSRRGRIGARRHDLLHRLHRSRGHDPLARVDRSARRGAGDRGDTGLGRAPRSGDRPGGRARLCPVHRHGAAGAVQRVRAHAVPR